MASGCAATAVCDACVCCVPAVASVATIRTGCAAAGARAMRRLARAGRRRCRLRGGAHGHARGELDEGGLRRGARRGLRKRARGRGRQRGARAARAPIPRGQRRAGRSHTGRRRGRKRHERLHRKAGQRGVRRGGRLGGRGRERGPRLGEHVHAAVGGYDCDAGYLRDRHGGHGRSGLAQQRRAARRGRGRIMRPGARCLRREQATSDRLPGCTGEPRAPGSRMQGDLRSCPEGKAMDPERGMSGLCAAAQPQQPGQPVQQGERGALCRAGGGSAAHRRGAEAGSTQKQGGERAAPHPGSAGAAAAARLRRVRCVPGQICRSSTCCGRRMLHAAKRCRSAPAAGAVDVRLRATGL